MSAGIIASARRYADEVLADSPTAYWMLDEASGDFADSSGNGRTLTTFGTLTYQASSIVSTYPYSIDGNAGNNGGYIIAGSWMNTSSLTVEAWIRPDALPATTTFLSKRSSSGANSATAWGFNIVDSKLAGYVSNGSSITSLSGLGSTTLTTGTIYHVALVIDTTNDLLTCYLNGAQEAQTAFTSTIGTGGDYVRVCYVTFTENDFNGSVAHVAMYGNALSAQRIAAHYAAGI